MYAPNYDVPENASPFVPLPILYRCTNCPNVIDPIEEMVIVRDGQAVRGLCPTCAQTLGGEHAE